MILFMIYVWILAIMLFLLSFKLSDHIIYFTFIKCIKSIKMQNILTNMFNISKCHHQL